MTIRDLTKLIAPPAQPVNAPTPADWTRAEAVLGTSLPSDYKDFLATYGEGRVGDFLDVFLPEARNEWHDLETALDQERQVFAERQFPLRYALYPARPGLLPIGQTDNGDMLFYLVEGDAESWKIAFYKSRGEGVEVFDGGLSAFLVSAFRGETSAFPHGVALSFTAEAE